MLDDAWQRGGHPLSLCLLPLAWLYAAVLWIRGLVVARPAGPPVPVIVVGNVTVGGVGKTPVVAWLADHLRAAGWRVGIISRGYGRATRGLRVHRPGMTLDASELGDEPAMLAERLGVPVAVAERRVDAVMALAPSVDVLIADDGLQHVGLGRSLEIAVVDGQRGLGNGRLLPAGPLRESARRLAHCDLVLLRDPTPVVAERIARHGVVASAFSIEAGGVRRLDGQPHDRTRLSDWRGARVHAVAGIGWPARFFDTLRAAGIDVIAHPFADHHTFTAEDLRFGETGPVLMTAKDAIKCRPIASQIGADHWYCVDVHAKLSAEARAVLDPLLARVLPQGHANRQEPPSG